MMGENCGYCNLIGHSRLHCPQNREDSKTPVTDLLMKYKGHYHSRDDKYSVKSRQDNFNKAFRDLKEFTDSDQDLNFNVYDLALTQEGFANIMLVEKQISLKCESFLDDFPQIKTLYQHHVHVTHSHLTREMKDFKSDIPDDCHEEIKFPQSKKPFDFDDCHEEIKFSQMSRKTLDYLKETEKKLSSVDLDLEHLHESNQYDKVVENILWDRLYTHDKNNKYFRCLFHFFPNYFVAHVVMKPHPYQFLLNFLNIFSYFLVFVVSICLLTSFLYHYTIASVHSIRYTFIVFGIGGSLLLLEYPSRGNQMYPSGALILYSPPYLLLWAFVCCVAVGIGLSVPEPSHFLCMIIPMNLLLLEILLYLNRYKLVDKRKIDFRFMFVVVLVSFSRLLYEPSLSKM